MQSRITFDTQLKIALNQYKVVSVGLNSNLIQLKESGASELSYQHLYRHA